MLIHAWERDFFYAAAILALALHLLFNLWFIFGAVFTKGRPRLAAMHIVSLIYGAIAENASFACPLTLLEQWCRARAGVASYRGPFEVHYLLTLVSPDFPLWILEYGAVAVFFVNAAVYARRFAQHHAEARHRRHAH